MQKYIKDKYIRLSFINFLLHGFQKMFILSLGEDVSNKPELIR